MTFSTALDIVTQGADELGIDVPSTLLNASDDDARQFLALMNGAGRDLARSYEWAALTVLATLSMVTGQTDYPVPDDYARMVDDTTWDITNRWRLFGPETPQQDRALRSMLAPPASITRGFRQRGTAVVSIWPTPTTTGDQIQFEYLSKNWAAGEGGTPQALFLADTDTSVFDPDLMVLEFKWRYLVAKRLDATAEKALRDLALGNLLGADQGGKTLDMGGHCDLVEGQVVAITSPNYVVSTSS